MPHRFAVTVHTSADVNYIPFVLCGLHDLAHDGLVSLDVRPALTEYELGHNATRLDIHALGSGRRVRVLVDMKDSARDIFPRDLGRHDLIFKRTYIPEVLGAMPELDASQRARILPMTPVFPTRSRHERHRLTFELARVAHVARRIRATELRNPRQIVRRFAREAWVPARDGRRLPFIDELEYPPGPTEPYILFQTRLFDPGIEGHNPVFFASKLEVNAQRIGLIRRLQRELGPAFRGGVVDDAYARRVAPDVITPLPTRRDAFLRLIREARAVIYTRGLVEAVPEQALLGQMAPNDDKFRLGVRGIANWEKGQIGRFGMKSQKATLKTFTEQAFSWELGISSRGKPEDPMPNAPPKKPKTPDISEEELLDVVFYQRYLGAPPRGPITREVENGERLFKGVGCAHCHTPSHVTGPNELGIPEGMDVPAYSDFLLHVMDEDLADQMVQGASTGQMWRTSPLWGLRLRRRYLHDGRTTDLGEAITLHGGEAGKVVEQYAGLSSQDKEQLKAFLNSL